jgi:hypothetical protein
VEEDMSKSNRLRLYFCGTASAVALFASAAGAQTLPTTPTTCPASGPLVNSPATTPFSAWFPTGVTPSTINAAVLPADSLNFSNDPNNNNTDFYRWSYRMFLWLTSPTPSTYGGTGLVMSSPEFYNLTPNAAGTQFVMTRNPVNPFLHFGPAKALEMARARPPAPLRLGLRVANLGPHGLPFVHDTAGNFMEVLPAKQSAAGRPLVLNAAGKEVEVARVVADAQGPPKFLDKKGATIATPQLQAHPQALRRIGVDTPALRQLAQPKFVFRINPSIINGKSFINGPPIFILPSGAVINTVVGDSEGNVQMTQAGSLIYYGIAVNDVYAYYVTQIHPLVPPTTTTALFPTTPAELTAIQTFATTKGHTLLDPNSLAMEIKTAWVDASTLTNPGDYITMRAVVPTYDKTNPALWTQKTATQTITAALVGIHVVGSVSGHPEMVWSTFEHVGNTPNVAYPFVIDMAGTQVNQPADQVNSTTKWLFCGAPLPTSNGTNAEFTPNAIATFSPAGIQAVNSTTTVQGTSVLRLAPWGAPNNQKPNPLVASVAASNTQIISLNNDIHTQMNPGDVRSKYLFLGATWTELGGAPSTNWNGTNQSGVVVGTSHLANSTLETFTQSETFVQGAFPGPGCFSCHTTNTVGVSHVFGTTQALP